MKLKSLSEESPQHSEQGFPWGYLIRGPVVRQKEKAGRTRGEVVPSAPVTPVLH